MQIVIDIDEYLYKTIKTLGIVVEDGDAVAVSEAIQNGTLLPKGHGRLIDADKLKVELECGIRAGNYEEGYEKYAHINNMDDCVDAVKYADTIIEADKERSDEE